MLSSCGTVVVVVVALVVLQTSSAQARIRPCPRIGCAPPCKPFTGKDGCPACDCAPSCLNVTCKPGYVCELQKVQCKKEPCYLQPTCVLAPVTRKNCPLFKCLEGCVKDIGPDGCQIGCACPPSCNTVKCSAGHECQLVQVTCVRDPCFPQPQCVEVKEPCPPQDPCGIRCMYGLKTDKNGCQLCDCLDKPLPTDSSS